ncbi:integrase catalytic domain-containing protein [Nephila pilipes]|uniref:Integrase catalytic domain-containing protein n=1 Tax=Nephila pilipes TaxID=299642 RepID=A0A8X6PXI6_NEPPI|nr:integrase catalytic domain-containing protein [Nephila pilipes]
MATYQILNKLQRKQSILRSKVAHLTGKLNNADGINKDFDVEQLEEALKDLKLVNEDIHDLLHYEDYERVTADCENILIQPCWRFLIPSGIYYTRNKSICSREKKLKLVHPPDNSSLTNELLIGGDYYWQIVTAESPTKLSESIVMVPSKFGWILRGSRTQTIITDNTSVH